MKVKPNPLCRTWYWVIGRSDVRDQLVLLNRDERGVVRVLDMTFANGEWCLWVFLVVQALVERPDQSSVPQDLLPGQEHRSLRHLNRLAWNRPAINRCLTPRLNL